ncbi:MAG: hypothetical protein H6605_04690 [Flavobacteriales bacterium]|nr:hypothetical protein [Flavobacteriales bacterium]
MNYAILIEDRVHRQKKHLEGKIIELNNFSFLKNVSGGQDFVDILMKLNKKEYTVLNEYSVIMLHRSAFETEIRNGLMDYLKTTNKKVVFFSGGISGCQISKIGNLEFLLINVNQFYSDNLLLFLKNNATNLLELAFGSNWQTSILVDAYEKLILYSKSFTKQPWSSIEVNLKLNTKIKEDYFFELSQKDYIYKTDLEVVLNKMNLDLNERIE